MLGFLYTAFNVIVSIIVLIIMLVAFWILVDNLIKENF
jgi:hypothetical protein